MRRCPFCRVRIEKNAGCTHMACERCSREFCWCCMEDDTGGKHKKCYRICPKLPYSYCTNLIITVLWILFLPVIMILVPFVGILGCSLYLVPFLHFERSRCWEQVLIWLICFLVLMPIMMAFGMLIAVIIGVIAILPLYFYSISFFVRLCVIGCRNKV